MSRQRPRKRSLSLEPLEDRVVLSTSVGWDGPGQGAAALTYYVGQVPAGMSLSQTAVNAAIKTALAAWSSVAKISFTQTTTPNTARSLNFTFKRLDGPGKVLAQGYFPGDVNPEPIAGDVQFDSTERWEVGNALGNAAIDFVQTAVHEIGHALGLDHSNVAGSVMYPSVSASQSFTALTATDKQAILALYAPASTATTTTPTTTTTTPTRPTTTTTTPTRPTNNWPWIGWRPRSWWSRYAARKAASTATSHTSVG